MIQLLSMPGTHRLIRRLAMLSGSVAGLLTQQDYMLAIRMTDPYESSAALVRLHR